MQRQQAPGGVSADPRTCMLLALILLWAAVPAQSTQAHATFAARSPPQGRGSRLGFALGISSSFLARNAPCSSRASCCRGSLVTRLLGEEARPRRGAVLRLLANAERRRVKAVFTDVDGTLLNSKHRLSEETIGTLKRAMDSGVPIVMATGKARGAWVGMMREQMGMSSDGWTLNGPGVFIQGLLVCDDQGNIVKRTLLTNEVVRQMNEFAAQRGVQIVAYTSDDEIVSAQADKYSDLLVPFSEPTPQTIGRDTMDLLSLGVGHPDAFKMILLAEEPTLAALRADLEGAIEGVACVTKAMERMLEVLPPGASKASGVLQALELLGLKPGDCMALGDGENDLEMLKMVREDGGVAVAVGNAVPKLKEAAEFIVGTNDENGVAEAIDRFILAAQAV